MLGCGYGFSAAATGFDSKGKTNLDFAFYAFYAFYACVLCVVVLFPVVEGLCKRYVMARHVLCVVYLFSALCGCNGIKDTTVN